MSDDPISLLHGSLSVLVLKTLSWGPMHGFGIARWIQRLTDEALRLEEGTLYPPLNSKEDPGWIKAARRTTQNKRRAK